jgi:hypothetical protein
MPVISPAAVWAYAGDAPMQQALATTKQIDSAPLPGCIYGKL